MAKHIGDDIAIGNVGDPPADGVRDQRERVKQHLLPNTLIKITDSDVFVQAGNDKKKTGGEQIGTDDCHDITEYTELKHNQKQHIEKNRRNCAQNAV